MMYFARAYITVFRYCEVVPAEGSCHPTISNEAVDFKEKCCLRDLLTHDAAPVQDSVVWVGNANSELPAQPRKKADKPDSMEPWKRMEKGITSEVCDVEEMG